MVKTEQDQMADDTWLVVALMDDSPNVVVGWTKGPEAEANAEEVARHINETGRQPPPRKATGLGYERAPGEDF